MSPPPPSSPQSLRAQSGDHPHARDTNYFGLFHISRIEVGARDGRDDPMLRVFLGFSGRGAVDRNGHLQHCAPAGRAFDPEHAKELCDPLLNAEQAEVYIVRSPRESWL